MKRILIMMVVIALSPFYAMAQSEWERPLTAAEQLEKAKQAEAEAKRAVKEAKKAASEALDLRDVEREMRKGRILAEAEHKEAVKQMKKDVEAEAKELKKLMEDK